MKFIDTHSHLYSDQFDTDRDLVIENAIKNGVTQIILPSIDSTYTQKMYDLEVKYPNNIFLMIGLHPCDVKVNNYNNELLFIENELKRRKFCAIGEIGIDLFWDQSTLDIQKLAFQKQIQLAKQYKLPINIHCRDAFNEVFEVLELEKGDDLFGVFHCFSGSLEDAKRAISYNLKLGIGGVVTFKNGKIDQFLNQIPLSEIVLETDSPYLAPVPYRGKRNESAYIPLIANKLAEIYNVSVQEVASITTQTTQNIFKI
jgi:TatD DNase family protein